MTDADTLHGTFRDADEIEVVEADTDPDDPRMGSAQFLLHAPGGAETIEEHLPEDGRVSDSPPRPELFVAALPPA